MTGTRICAACGRRFGARDNAIYCSAKCKQAAYRERTGGGQPMTSRERSDLMGIVRRREKLAQKQVDVRASELMADFEHQMASIYEWNDDAVWAEAVKTAHEATAEADAKVAARCKELGIPDEFRGGISAHWSHRGQNAIGARQTELRRVARTQVEALSKTAKHAIEEGAVAAMEHLAASGLKSAEAQTFLAAMPTPDDLMPTLNVEVVERALTEPKTGERRPYISGRDGRLLVGADGHPEWGTEVNLLPDGGDEDDD
jgi:hypothetical protein